jgi:hypothetical protein
MQTIEIIIPEKLSTNKVYNLHHFAKAKWNKDIYQSVKVAVIQQKIKPIKEYPIICTYIFHSAGRSLDLINLGAMIKAIEDGLRYANILKDDTLKEVCQITLLEEKSDREYSYFVLEIN